LQIAILDILALFWESRTSERVTRLLDKFEDVVQDKIGPSLFTAVTQVRFRAQREPLDRV